MATSIATISAQPSRQGRHRRPSVQGGIGPGDPGGQDGAKRPESVNFPCGGGSRFRGRHGLGSRRRRCGGHHAALLEQETAKAAFLAEHTNPQRHLVTNSTLPGPCKRDDAHRSRPRCFFVRSPRADLSPAFPALLLAVASLGRNRRDQPLGRSMPSA